MELQSRQQRSIKKGHIISYKELATLFTEGTIKLCFRQCTEKEFYSSSRSEALGSQSFEYAICTRPIEYYIETRY